MAHSTTRYHILFSGLLNDIDDEDDDEEIDLGELDARAYSMQGDLDLLQPNRAPKLEIDYLGNNGEIELLFNFKISWIDRDSDIADYLDEVQSTVENNLNMIINEREFLGYTTR